MTEKAKNTEVQEVKPERTYVPAVNIYENSEKYVLLADMPGVDEKSVSAHLKDGVLSIEGHTMAEPDAAALKILHREFSGGRFKRAFQLADNVDANQIQARMKAGVLSVTLPKKEEARPRKIEIAAE